MTSTRTISSLAAGLFIASSIAFAQAASRGPIIDVHLHAYPPDEAIPDIANPANGKKPGSRTARSIARRSSPR